MGKIVKYEIIRPSLFQSAAADIVTLWNGVRMKNAKPEWIIGFLIADRWNVRRIHNRFDGRDFRQPV